MDEDEAELLSLTRSLSPSASEPTQALAMPPPMAPIPPPPPAAPALTIDDYEISEESRLARERQEKAIQDRLLKRRAYVMAVPTNDSAVRARLRRLNEPVTLFGEREMERRDRLRALMSRLEAEGQLDALLKAHDVEEPVEEEDDSVVVSYPFYTEGVRELVECRKEIARFSVGRARERIARARRRREDPDEDEEGEAKEACRAAAEFVLECSEIGDDRPLSGCSFSRDGTMLATR